MNTEPKFHYRKYSQGYLRWKKQLQALNSEDFDTVKELAEDARKELDIKRKGLLTLPHVN